MRKRKRKRHLGQNHPFGPLSPIATERPSHFPYPARPIFRGARTHWHVGPFGQRHLRLLSSRNRIACTEQQPLAEIQQIPPAGPQSTRYSQASPLPADPVSRWLPLCSWIMVESTARRDSCWPEIAGERNRTPLVTLTRRGCFTKPPRNSRLALARTLGAT
jgi:hypothetical protein